VGFNHPWLFRYRLFRYRPVESFHFQPLRNRLGLKAQVRRQPFKDALTVARVKLPEKPVEIGLTGDESLHCALRLHLGSAMNADLHFSIPE